MPLLKKYNLIPGYQCTCKDGYTPIQNEKYKCQGIEQVTLKPAPEHEPKTRRDIRVTLSPSNGDHLDFSKSSESHQNLL